MPRFSIELSGLALAASAAVASAEPAMDLVKEGLVPFLETHCFECHDDSVQKADLNLLDLAFEPGKPGNAKLWERIFDRVESGEMPPAKNPRPEAGPKSAFLGHLEAPLLAHDRAAAAEKGRVNVRRLTRREYEFSVHDLLGIDIPLEEELPEDPATHGFETVAEGQQLSHFNLARYLDVADRALGEAFGRALEGEKTFARDFPANSLGQNGPQSGNFRGPETRGDEAIAWPIRLQFYGRMPATRVSAPGWYRITLKDVRAINAESGSVWGTLRSGSCASNEPMLYPIGLVEATEKARDLTFDAWIRGDHMLELKPGDMTRKSAPTGASGGNVGYRGRDLEKQGFEGIALTSIRMERFYPNAERWEVRRNLFGENGRENLARWNEPTSDDAATLLGETILPFARRAFRRPVTAEDVAPYVELALREIEGKGKRLVDGLRVAYQAVLCSPRFLTFVEEPGPLDDHAVASRLSFMLWNSMPDAELRGLADKGKLRDGKTLHVQIDRLLDSPKSERFIASFTDQWLNLRDIEFTSPDRRLYPTFDPVVQDSMVAETRAFVRELVQSDRKITDIIQSDYAMLNERLARFYGLDDLAVEPGGGLQKVSLGKKNPRGGLITQGAVLKVTANGTTTSPVVRGVWVGERILGLEIPPPPADVPAVEPDIRGAVSIRDQLEKHRNSESCAACHLKIDPAGFALESFDPVGRWRTRYGSKKSSASVDPSGVTPDGAAFTGIDQWKKIYLARPEQITRGFARQLLTYATGAPMRFSDRAALDALAQKAGEKNFGTRAILHLAIDSEIFLTK